MTTIEHPSGDQDVQLLHKHRIKRSHTYNDISIPKPVDPELKFFFSGNGAFSPNRFVDAIQRCTHGNNIPFLDGKPY